MKRSIGAILLLTVFCVVSGQNEDQFLPSELKQLTVVTEPATLRKGFFRVGGDWTYTSFKWYYDENAKKQFAYGSTLAKSSATEISLQYGITDRLQLNLNAPFMMDRVQSSIILNDPLFRAQQQVDFEERGTGLGDLSVGLFYQLIKDKDRHPSVTVRGTLMTPTGRKNPGNYSSDSLKYDIATGSGEFSFAVDVQVRKIKYPYSFTSYSGIEYGFGGEKIMYPGEAISQFRSGTKYYTAGSIGFHLNDWITMTNDVYFNYIGEESVNSEMSDTKWSILYIPHVQFQIKKLRLVQGMLIPVAGKLYPANPTYLIIVQYII